VKVAEIDRQLAQERAEQAEQRLQNLRPLTPPVNNSCDGNENGGRILEAIQGQVWVLEEKVKAAERDRQLAQEQAVQAERRFQSFQPPALANSACDHNDEAMQAATESRRKESGPQAPAISDDEHDEVRPKSATIEC
jgi:hypothetical protein